MSEAVFNFSQWEVIDSTVCEYVRAMEVRRDGEHVATIRENWARRRRGARLTVMSYSIVHRAWPEAPYRDWLPELLGIDEALEQAKQRVRSVYR